MRLGADVPFARAAFWLHELCGITVSAATMRRQTEAVGASAVALAEAQVAPLERAAPAPPVQPERLVLGADGAMVPLVGGEWGEVKLLSIGEPAPVSASRASVRAQHVSYFARLADAQTFGAQALGEMHRRGVEAAGAVAAVQDGAPWLQGFVDYHRPDAVRILDWPHAAEHLTSVAEAVFGVQTPRAQRVAERLRRWLWAEGPTRVLAILAGWERAQSSCPAIATGLATGVAYFRERLAHLDYPAFRAAGWPVGSGATERGHKQVMQARMKRAGMRWVRAHVNPLLALTLLDHNDRWASDVPMLLAQHRAHLLEQRRQQQRQRQAARHAAPPLLPAPPPTACSAASAPLLSPRRPTRLATDPPAPQPASHPWRRYGPWVSTKN